MTVVDAVRELEGGTPAGPCLVPGVPVSRAPAAPVLVEDRGPVRVITLNRPEVRNAINLDLRYALADAVEAADADPSVRAIVLTGADGAFCSGGDIATMQRAPRHETTARAQAAQRVVRALWHTPKPVVAAVEGPAFGAGAALALACDRVVAAADATFATTFTTVGLAGDMGIFASLPARVGPARARQMLMLGTRVSGSEAGAMGLVDCVVEPGSALDVAMADATMLAAGPPLALGVIKQMLSGEPRHPLAVLDLEVHNQVSLWDTDDFTEGVAAFAERRRPSFGTPALRRSGD
ncbi:enoyl-CoA hydratase/isomerase family protein [Nocardioides stalactiti]|uniref:enoyl-CoA hydratase/isomerase family protein n=1 Tax=Nocardioides stalactiti TaxID=2755356 RepID=UPI0016007468|nr:enoyl-CoA hydratase-related protein [Nocardioides stalactiti]